MEPGPSNAVDDLFNNAKGWILTKQESGKARITECDDQSIIDERKWIETTIMNKTKTDTFKLPFYQADKAVKLFIRDLLICEKTGIYFKFSEILFNQVYLCGIISFFETRNENIYIKVDDGTTSIKCIIKRENLQKLKALNPTDIPIDKNNVVLEAAHIFKRNLLHLKKQIPSINELTRGTMVKIIGKMSEYKDKRYVFINRIMIANSLEHVEHLRKLTQNYTKYYYK